VSTNQRRRALAEEQRIADEERQAEEFRVSQLSLYMRIEECADIHDIKGVLHLIAEKAGIDEHE
jgi:hypothetical protein